MAIGRFLFPFFAGVAVGALLHKHWPEITAAARPYLRSSLLHGSNLLEKGRSAVHDQGERLSDVISEIREEQEAAARAQGAQTGTTSPTGNQGPAKPSAAGSS